MRDQELVKARIDDFLASETPEILCIRGSWGVGKTYSWRQYYRAAVADQTVRLQRYSYVSMFGINSLDGLKAATFENVQIATNGKNETLLEAIKGGTNSALTIGARFFGSAVQAAADLGGLGALGAARSALLFASVREQIICIDDLERVGDGLTVRDVMGYISFMKEERDCKVVLLLNDRQLRGESAEQFTQDFEKVVDQSIVLAPQPSEVARIALNSDQPTLAKRVADLGITNFRVIQKIARALGLCEGVLRQFDSEVADQAATAMTILGWSLYRAEGAPPIEFLRGLETSRISRMLIDTDDPEPEQAEEQKRWHSTLETYHFSHLDEFDEALLRVMEAGFCDPDALRPAAAAKEQEILQTRGQTSLKNAWAFYHASFDDDLPDVIAAFKDALDEYASSIQIGDLFQVAELFWGLGLETDAEGVVSAYKDARGKLEYDDHHFARYVKSEKLSEFIRATLGDGKVPVPDDILSMFRRLETGSWNDDHVEKLGAFSIEEFVSAFRAFRGEELTDIGRACLQWRNVSNPTDGMMAVQGKAEAALRLIGQESALNKSRLKKFGLGRDL